MIRSLFQIEPLLALIEADTLILTPNNRLRNNIKLAYQAHLGNQVVASPRIYSLTEWQALLWQQLQNRGDPLSLVCVANNSQLECIWQQVIENAGVETTGAGTPLERRALARQARDAQANLLAWQQDPRQLNCDPEITEWITAFEQQLQQHQLITTEQMQQRLFAAFETGALEKEAAIYCHSFIDITPMAQRLLEAAAGDLVHLTKIKPDKCKPVRTVAEDGEAEIKAACDWAWQQLQENPQATIAIIAPQLARDRTLIERQLTETFESHCLDPATPRSALPFNISAAQPLAQTPLIAGTLQLLQLNLNQLPVQQLSAILHSPFFGNREIEWPLRCFAVSQLKSRASFTDNLNTISQDLQRFCEQTDTDDPNLQHYQQLSKNLLQWLAMQRRQPQAQTPSQWLHDFLQQLQTVGWPGARRVDSIEYQQINHWHTALEQFATIDDVVGKVSVEAALALLKDACQASPFQAETRDTPIHVLGAFEAVGLHASHCWILGVDDKDWPAPLQPNPLLPKQLQSRLQLPKASLTREIEIASQLLDHYSRIAEQIVFSHARQHANTQANVSSLIGDIDYQAIEQLLAVQSIGLPALKQNLRNQQTFAWVDCSHGPPLHTSPEHPASGGQKLFALQAQSPFNAFAELRLKATAAEKPGVGFGPKEKGIIIHNALASIWEHLQTQEQLIATTDSTLKQLVTKAIITCCTQIGKKDAALLGDYYYRLEQQRLIGLLLDWLSWEKLRPPFQVLATEQNLAAEFGGVHLRMRIDRVDQLADGGILLIDYKTAPHTTASWMQERPNEPQLPLYSLCYQQPVGGIAFAIVSNDELGMRGLADRHDVIAIDGVKSTKAVKVESWQAFKNLLQERLQDLAKEIIAGDCRVMFSGGYQPSRDPFAPLNRVFERDYIHYRLRQSG